MAGRPPKEISEAAVKALAAAHCTMEEIAAAVNCSVDTIERRFKDVVAAGREAGKVSLRRAQWRSALGSKKRQGNIVMQIWLGKNVLGQKDKVELGGEGGRPIEHVVTLRFAEKPAA